MATIVTTYVNPDLDGYASVYAYSEFLLRTGGEAHPLVWGDPLEEVKFTLAEFGIGPIETGEDFKPTIEAVVLVDKSNLYNLPERIAPERVVEIIDHHDDRGEERFIRARFQIERVGACATLIAEKFHLKGIEVSREAAALLFAAIISNTVNLRSDVTTERDSRMAKWLQGFFTLPEGFMERLFEAKSKMVKPIDTMLEDDLKCVEFGGVRMGIAQLEVQDAERLVREHLDPIRRSLSRIKTEKRLDLVFLNCVDTRAAQTLIYTMDARTSAVLTTLHRAAFDEDGIAIMPKIMLRKEHLPLLRDFYEKGTAGA